MLRWTPGVVPLWRGAGNIQIGSDPRTSFVLEGLSPAEQRFVEALAQDVGGERRAVIAQLPSTAAASSGAASSA